MKILAICGSPRGRKSQTRILVEKVLETAKGKGAGVELVDLSKAQIGFCRACEKCHQGPGCILGDDGNRILDKVLATDGLVLASPVYVNQVTAQMKALLDRSSHFIHCLRLMGKYVAAVTTYGGADAGVQEYLKNYSLTVGAQFVGGMGAKVPLKDSDLAAAAALGETLVAAIQGKKVFPEQTRIIEERKRYFAQLVERRKDVWAYEYNYWQKSGLL